jgi:phosphoenolpyruvate carboxylase
MLTTLTCTIVSSILSIAPPRFTRRQNILQGVEEREAGTVRVREDRRQNKLKKGRLDYSRSDGSSVVLPRHDSILYHFVSLSSLYVCYIKLSLPRALSEVVCGCGFPCPWKA